MENTIKQFLDKVASDPSLASQYKDAKDLGAVSSLASSLGFSVSAAELQDYFSNNLSDEDLGGITGGSSVVKSSGGSHGGWYSGD